MIVVELVGMKEFFGSMKGLEKEVLPAAKEVLYAEAQDILTESRKEVPFRRGVLSASGRVHEPFIAGKKAMVEITYGGAAGGNFEGENVGYAIIQHENTMFRHAEGRKAYYLRDPLERAKGEFSERFGRRLKMLLEYRRQIETVKELED